MRKKKSSDLYLFLENEGVLNNDIDEIKKAKTKYWNEYRKKWKKNKRKECKSFEILLNTKEHKIVHEKALTSQQSMTAYIKHTALHGQSSSAIILGEIRQLLVLEYHFVETRLQEENISAQKIEKILSYMEGVEKKVVELLNGKK